jgi:hypothetical protein
MQSAVGIRRSQANSHVSAMRNRMFAKTWECGQRPGAPSGRVSPIQVSDGHTQPHQWHISRPRATYASASTVQAAAKYLTEYVHKPSIGRSALALKDMDRFIGDKWLDSERGEPLKRYIEARRAARA